MRPRALLGLCLLGCALRPALPAPPCAPAQGPPRAGTHLHPAPGPPRPGIPPLRPAPGPSHGGTPSRSGTPPRAPPRSKCPRGWLDWRGGCYGYFGREVTWRQAEGWCRMLRRGCHLASVLSAEEQRALAAFVSQCQRAKEEEDVWIGLQYRSAAWAWADGSKLRYLAWDDDDFAKGQHCAVLDESSGFLAWDDDGCSERNPFVCKCKG